MRLRTSTVDIPRGERVMRAFVARPADEVARPPLLFYSDIFQITPSTQRMIERFAGYGFVVAAPEIYWRYEAPGAWWAFDDPGRDRGQHHAETMTTAAFDADIAALIAAVRSWPGVHADAFGAVGFCTGGHIAFRAALSPLVKRTVLYYPTGLHDGVLGGDRADSLERVAEITGALLCVFGTRDPHTDAAGRETVARALAAARIDARLSLYDSEHAFMRDEGPRYDPAATDAAFAEGITLLRGGV
jgi:carboxymethylenebutenolidase